VDSVAEHQPANEQAYKTYLHHTYAITPYGFALGCLYTSPASRFLVLWACVVFFFANKVSKQTDRQTDRETDRQTTCSAFFFPPFTNDAP
jgi:hypothetical protein